MSLSLLDLLLFFIKNDSETQGFVPVLLNHGQERGSIHSFY